MDLLQEIKTIHDKLLLITAMIDTDTITENQKLEVIRELMIVSAIADEPNQKLQQNIKSVLELKDSAKFGGYMYSYKISERNSFDTNKAKDKLVESGYNLEDFLSTTQVKRLYAELIKK